MNKYDIKYYRKLFELDIPNDYKNNIIYNYLNRKNMISIYFDQTNIDNDEIIELFYLNFNKDLVSSGVSESIETVIIHKIFIEALRNEKLYYIIDDCLKYNINLSSICIGENVLKTVNLDMLTKLVNYGFNIIDIRNDDFFIMCIEHHLIDRFIIKFDDIYAYKLYQCLKNNIEIYFADGNKADLEDIYLYSNIDEYFDGILELLNEKNYDLSKSRFIEYCKSYTQFKIFIDNGYQLYSKHFTKRFIKLLNNEDNHDIIIMLVHNFGLDLEYMCTEILKYDALDTKINKMKQLFESLHLDFYKITDIVRKIECNYYGI